MTSKQALAPVQDTLDQANRTHKGTIRVKTSVLRQAKNNNADAICSMFQQFIPEDEEIYRVEYLGIKGVFGIGASSFACLTRRRVADITVGFFGEVTYEDAFLEQIKSSAIYQPSRLSLFILSALTILLALLLIVLVLPQLYINPLFKFIPPVNFPVIES